MKMKTALLCVATLTATVFAAEGPQPRGISDFDHVFLIMMENHGYSQIVNNPNAPFINQFAHSANMATNYFAVGHPSLTNYLEIVGGSNFGVRSDAYPNWHSSTCTPNLVSGTPILDNPVSSPELVCPIAGTGTDAATPAVDCTNEVQTNNPANCLWDIDGHISISAAPNTVAKTIGDQLVEHGRSWKSYQESLPITGPDNVNYSDGFFTNNTNFSSYIAGGSFSSWSIQGVRVPAVQTQSDANGDIVYLYAVKHNPFAYFRDVQQGSNPHNSLKNVAGFDGLYQDLGTGNVPDFSFIAPNQCNDQHGRSNNGPFCNFDAVDNGTQSGLNEPNILMGDITVQRLVTAIKNSTAWTRGNNAIVLVWDENDYTATLNKVLLVVDTNRGANGVQSSSSYNSFSLLKSLESAFDLPCLNHACDSNVNVMSDLFTSNGSDHGSDGH